MRKINLQEIVKKAVSEGAKSVFLFPGFPPLGNKREITKLGEATLAEEEVEDLLRRTTTEWQYATFKREKELDYGYEIEKLGRSRICAFVRKGSTGMVIRPIPAEVPSFKVLDLPEVLKKLTDLRDGLVFVTGPTGSGKSTTLASLLDIINEQRACHIVTLEDPIEFIYRPKASIISQREIGRDSYSFSAALKRMLREDPDVVLVGEVRDRESMQAVLEIAETGHLVFSTLHTSSVVESVNRIIDFFPQNEKTQVRSRLSQVLKGVVSQRLMPRIDGKGFACACEVMFVNHSVRNLIKDDKIHQILSIMSLSKKEGMVSMDEALVGLAGKGLVDVSYVIRESSRNKNFIEKVIHVAADKKESLAGRTIIDFDREMILYETTYANEGLQYLDASGTLMDTPDGLFFRDTGGQVKDDLNFVIDYTILNGRKASFPLKTLFNVSYKITGAKAQKPGYIFFLRLVADFKEEIRIPKEPVHLLNNGEWNTLTVPVPAIHSGKLVKYFMLLFDKDVKEIFFNNMHFV